ncbi:MAG: response regulator [Desulfobacteraceae bacterium]|nr:response regulator [Desulfobacteraceae bacterium]
MRQSAPPSLLVLDWMMPGNGLSLCRKLHILKRSLPFYVILLSEGGKQSEIIRGLEAGVDDYLKKPYVTRNFLPG